MPKILIVDYGVGNILSLKFALEKVGLIVEVAYPDKKDGLETDGLVLPGVGNFSAVAKKIEPIKENMIDIIKEGKPVLGICLGLQLFFQCSEEGIGKGLSIFKGKNLRLNGPIKVPHMGWNSLQIVKSNELLEEIEDGEYVYFVHSLYPNPEDKTIICTETEYYKNFVSSIYCKNIFGTQFHPEKSGTSGLKILNNFAKIIKK